MLGAISMHAQKLSKLKKASLEQAEKLQQQVEETSQQLWDFSETALKENQSAEYLMDMLEKEGFTMESDIAGMPTAFVGTYGSGKPVIGILAEYDALPGVGNEPIPEKKPRADGVTAGQGCGHNLFGAASVNAAIALKRTMAAEGIGGTIKLYGTPAEETVVGKVYMAKAGVFDDLDACLEWHPDLETQVNNKSSLANNNFTIEYFGQSAHGAADPWNGRSALDAVELLNFGVNQMREHILPTARIHYVITDGGGAPNVVPDRAKVWYFVRDLDREKVTDHYGRLLKIAEGAAIATGTTYEVTFITGVHAYNLNRPLLQALQANLEYVGAPKFTEEEQQWGRTLQRNTGKEEKGFNTAVKPLAAGEETITTGSGSTDVAEVSFITPTAGFGVTSAPAGVPWHSWATTASHGTTAGFKAAVVATKVITLTGIDLLTNPRLVSEAQAEFQKKSGGRKYKSPLPEGQITPPLN
jgi:aminobenzoyl-glutamate utilization protein B